MNKVILGLILAVCVLGMALVMLNERLGRKNDYSVHPAQMADSGFSQDTNLAREKVDVPAGGGQVVTSPEIAEAARAVENNEARAALAPPAIQPVSPREREMSMEQEKEALRLAAEVQLSSEAATPRPSLPAEGVEQPPKLPEKPARAPDIPKNQAKQPDSQKIFEQHQKPRLATELPETKVSPPEVVEKTKPAKPAEKPRAAQTEKPKTEKPVAEKPKPPSTAERSGPSAIQQDVKKFVIYARENGATVRIAGNNSMAWRSMMLDNPPRVVVDLDGVWNFPPNPGVPKNDLVNNVRVGKTSDNRTRVVIDLKQKPKNARVIGAKDGEGIDVRVDK